MKTRCHSNAPAIRRWTKVTLECFERGCVCEGCFYNDFFTSPNQKCQAKKSVIESVRTLGSPPEVKEKTILEDV